MNNLNSPAGQYEAEPEQESESSTESLEPCLEKTSVPVLEHKLVVIGTGGFFVCYGVSNDGDLPALIFRKYKDETTEFTGDEPLTEDDVVVAFNSIEQIQKARNTFDEAYPQFTIRMNDAVSVLSRTRNALDVVRDTLDELITYEQTRKEGISHAI